MRERGPNGFQTKMIRIFRTMGRVVNIENLPEAGWPDLLVLTKDWKGFIECKVGSNSLEPSQIVKMKELQGFFPAYVLRYVSDARLRVESHERHLFDVNVGSFEWVCKELESRKAVARAILQELVSRE